MHLYLSFEGGIFFFNGGRTVLFHSKHHLQIRFSESRQGPYLNWYFCIVHLHFGLRTDSRAFCGSQKVDPDLMFALCCAVSNPVHFSSFKDSHLGLESTTHARSSQLFKTILEVPSYGHGLQAQRSCFLSRHRLGVVCCATQCGELLPSTLNCLGQPASASHKLIATGRSQELP